MSANEERQIAASARMGWLLSTPALVLLTVAAAGPLIIVLVYSFLQAGQYGNVEWAFSWDGWIGTLFSRDIFDGTLQLADAHLTILWRSVKLSLQTTFFTFLVGFPTRPDYTTDDHPLEPVALDVGRPRHRPGE